MDILKDIFEQSMKRERKEITLWGTETTVDCFFRKSNDNTNLKDTMIIYYHVDSPIRMGSLLVYSDRIFLVLNQETAENEIYKKSAIIRCDGEISTHDFAVSSLPFYGGDHVNNSMVFNASNYSVLDGNLEILTSDCPEAHELKINDVFNAYGRTWKISNIFFIDGICHIQIEVTVDAEIVYNDEVQIAELQSYTVSIGDTDSLLVAAFRNEDAIEAEWLFTSSDDEIASIDEHGNITYLSEGTVRFTAEWKETGISKTTAAVTVSADDGVNIFVQELGDIAVDFEETLAFYAVRNGERDDSITVDFRVENVSGLTNPSNMAVFVKKIKITDNGDNTINLEVNDYNMIGRKFDLVAFNEELEIENRQTIRIVSLF